MSGARTIETLEDRAAGVLRVRLCDGSQVLTERAFSYRDLYLDAEERYAWEYSRRCMLNHDDLLQQALGSASAATERELAATYFSEAVRALFPEFGTVPDGVEDPVAR